MNQSGLSDSITKTSGNNSKTKETTKDGTKKRWEKKMDFFAKWRASTNEAYEKHGVAGGNL